MILPKNSLVTRIRCKNVYSFLVKGSDGYMLVDTGFSETVEHLMERLAELDVKPEEIKLIVLTHTHFDHASGTAKLKKLTGAQVAVHRSEQRFLQRGYSPLPHGTRWKGRYLFFLAKYFAPFIGLYPAAEPDLLIDDTLDLASYGFPGKVIHTPGHTQGSVTVLLDNGEALVGDNVLGIGSKECFPPYADYKDQVLISWQKIADAGGKVLYPGHGKPKSIDDILKELPSAREKYL